MKTKQLLLSFIMSLFISNFYAQDIKLAAQLGVNFSSMSKKVSSEIEDELFTYFDYRAGMRIGLLAEYELKNGLALQSGLFYTQKGYYKDLKKMEELINEDSSDKEDVSGKWGNRYNYLEMPFHLVYNINDFSLFAGPYLAYGLGGKAIMDLNFKDRDTGETESYKGEADISAVTGDVTGDELFDGDVMNTVIYKKFDYGIDLGVGYKYDKFLAQIQYSIGLVNTIPSISDGEINVDKDFNLKNKGFSISISYYFK